MTSRNDILVLSLGNESLSPSETTAADVLENRIVRVRSGDFAQAGGRTADEASRSMLGIEMPLLPDWDELDAASTTEDQAGYRRYRARRSILCREGRAVIEGKLAHAPKSSVLMIVCDLTDPFATGILWDVAAMARAILTPSKLIGLLGLPVEIDEQQSEDRAELYATLKELNAFFLRSDPGPGSMPLVMDRVFFADRRYLTESGPAKDLVLFLRFLTDGEFLNSWLSTMESSLPTQHHFCPLPQPSGDDKTSLVEKRPCAFSGIFPANVDSSSAAEVFHLRLGRDVLQELLGGDETTISSEEILETLGLSERSLLQWIAEEVEESTKRVPEEKPLPADEFNALVLSSLSHVIARANERSSKLFARKDLPGRLGKEIDRLLDQFSLRSVRKAIIEMEEHLQRIAREYSARLYAAFAGVQPLAEFIEDFARRKTDAEAMIRDQASGKFLPALAHGIRREDLKTISSHELAKYQSSYLRAQIAFTACGQCVAIVQCALEDFRQFIMEAMKVREMVLSQCDLQIENILKEIPSTIAATIDLYWEWMSQLPESLHPRVLTGIIRSKGLPSESTATIHLRQLERGYPHSFRNALLTFLRKQLEEEKSDPEQWIVKSRLLPEAIASAKSQQSTMVMDPPDSSWGLKVENCVCSPLPPEKTLKMLELSGETCSICPTSMWGFYRFVHGFPLTFLKDISSWHFDYFTAIEAQKPVHVLKSAVYTQNPYLDPQEPLPLPAEPLFWACLVSGIIEQDEKGAAAYTGKRECHWGVFWDKAGDKPIWMEKEEFLKALQHHLPLQQELSALIVDHLGSKLEGGVTYDEVTQAVMESVENLRGTAPSAASQVRLLLEQVRPDVENTLSISMVLGSSHESS